MPSRPSPVRPRFEPVHGPAGAPPGGARPPAGAPGRPASRTAARPRRRPRRWVRATARIVLITGLFAGVLWGGAVGVAAWLERMDAEPRVVRCAAALDGTDWYLEPGQADVAALLAGQALARGLPARALTIALATGLQESKLANIEHGDRDSLGIFQQRPSQGWGTPEQVLDPVYATNAFYDALVKVDGYDRMAVTEAAQAVQRSAFPDAYAQHEVRARAWASALYGYSEATVTCTLDQPDGPGDPQAVVDRAARDLGLAAVVREDGAVVLDATPLGASPEHAERLGWGVAHWAVAVAHPLALTGVEHAGAAWDREDGWGHRPSDAPALAPGQVVLHLAD